MPKWREGKAERETYERKQWDFGENQIYSSDQNIGLAIHGWKALAWP
jgi:hypothetical protein